VFVNKSRNGAQRNDGQISCPSLRRSTVSIPAFILANLIYPENLLAPIQPRPTLLESLNYAAIVKLLDLLYFMVFSFTCSSMTTTYNLMYLLFAQQETNPLAILLIIGAIGVCIAFLVIFGVFVKFFRLWIQSVTTGAGIGILDLLGMTFRKVDPEVIVRAQIMAVKAGLTEVTSKSLEAHYLAGGRVNLVVQAMIAASKAKIVDLDYKLATAIDLAGRNVLEAVQTSVYPKVIDCPMASKGRLTLDGVAKNGIQLKVKARVTVRANLRQLIGGATEETIIARVGEGIVSAIGSSETHGNVLENPDLISKAVLDRRLDSQTAFEIVSIDIADIDVGDNIGARLQADQAEADTQVARAKAEGRRALAVAQEQENIAKIEASRAKVVEAEIEVPTAISEAIHSGKLGLMDYYRLKNIQADTEMRGAISKAGTSVT